MNDTFDPIDPPWYQGRDGLSLWDVFESWGLGSHLSNALKYTVRASHPGCMSRARDLGKASAYLVRATAVCLTEGSSVLVCQRSRYRIDPDRVIASFAIDPPLDKAVQAIWRAAYGDIGALDSARLLIDRARYPGPDAPEPLPLPGAPS